MLNGCAPALNIEALNIVEGVSVRIVQKKLWKNSKLMNMRNRLNGSFVPQP